MAWSVPGSPLSGPVGGAGWSPAVTLVWAALCHEPSLPPAAVNLLSLQFLSRGERRPLPRPLPRGGGRTDPGSCGIRHHGTGVTGTDAENAWRVSVQVQT